MCPSQHRPVRPLPELVPVPGRQPHVHGAEEKLSPIFIHALYSISSEAVGGPSSEVKFNPGVFFKKSLTQWEISGNKSKPI